MIAFDTTVDRFAAILDDAEQIIRNGLVAAYHIGAAGGN